MEMPVRCFSCGKVIGHLYTEFEERVKKGENPEQVFEDMNLNRYCCRRMLLSHVDLTKEVIMFRRI